MILGTFFPFLSIVVISSPSSLGLLFPPEGNDYPLYDFPSVQYVPHNTLVEYQDPRQSAEEVDEDKMEVATRSTYFPISSKDTLYPIASSSSPSSSSTSPQSYPYPPPPHPHPSSHDPSSSHDSETLACTTDDIAKMLNTEDLDKMIKVVAKIEGKSVKDLLIKLATKHGLLLKSGHRGSPLSPPSDTLRNLQLLDTPPAPQRSLIHLRRPPKGIPPTAGDQTSPLVEERELFDPVAIEVPAVSPRGLAAPLRMQALVVVEDGSREEVARMAVELGPRMALLDVLKEAKLVFALDNGPYRHNPFAIKARKLEIERCLALQSVGRITAEPNSSFLISVTRTRPLPEVLWESPCLPRVSELLIHPGDVIVLTPR
ncbi:uncharacterized protein [Macrobrachium rosenbergii]|uniref:uncharacterized protein n=1 Tax=Macrobrachium rosenbergii TaxID=79674 RepID=UPI0034D724A7